MNDQAIIGIILDEFIRVKKRISELEEDIEILNNYEGLFTKDTIKGMMSELKLKKECQLQELIIRLSTITDQIDSII